MHLSLSRIHHAVSEDGLLWELHPDSPVLGPSKEQGDWFYFDAEHVGVGDVLVPGKSAQSLIAIQDGVFFMYIFGGNSDKSKSLTPNPSNEEVIGAKLEIGVAISQDGAHWSRIEGESAYGSILEVGSSGDFDELSCGWPCVIEDGNVFNLYYHSFNARTGKSSIGVANSSNGIKWKKRGIVLEGGKEKGCFDERGVSRRSVIKTVDGSYRMYFEAISSEGVHSIGLATSRDGYRWEKVGNGPVFAPSEEEKAFDSGGVGSPKLVGLPDGRWRMYYVGTPRGGSGVSGDSYEGNESATIGVAESSDPEGMYFERLPSVGSN